MAFELPNLPYPNDALQPHIDQRTMEIHHGKHHQAYITNVNGALEGHADLQAKSVEQLLREINQVPDNIRQAVINNDSDTVRCAGSALQGLCDRFCFAAWSGIQSGKRFVEDQDVRIG